MDGSNDGLNQAWAALDAHGKRLGNTSTRELIAEDPARFDAFAHAQDGWLVDFSRQRVDRPALAALHALAEAADLPRWRNRMFAGHPINLTEGRAVLHTALRDRSGGCVFVDGEDVAPAIAAVLAQLRAFSRSVFAGDRRGFHGDRFERVIHIGIGGSDLGPRLAVQALGEGYPAGLPVSFVANVDGTDIRRALRLADPARTLFIVASKSFTTDETMTNAHTARRWLIERLGDEAAVAKHFVALSTNEEAMSAFGIAADARFAFWDFVGGRFSVWSAIGLPVLLAIGPEGFEQFLAGAYAMDCHFRDAPIEKNLPMLLALFGIWNRNILKIDAHAVLPYDERLARLPAYLQQAEMESNGKRVTRDGKPVARSTCPIVFGEPGTNGQHAFFQLLHQGTDLVSMDFLAAARPPGPLGEHHDKLLANCLAQGEALALGLTEAEVQAQLQAAGLAPDEVQRLLPHKVFPGGRPLTTILFETLDPYTLGRLLALYEHKVFCQGVLWDINAFDQWGVELGKTIAKRLLPGVVDPRAHPPASVAEDPVSQGLLAWLANARR